jgi:hypothetical protein
METKEELRENALIEKEVEKEVFMSIARENSN